MQVGIILGSRSQWSTMKHTAKLLAQLGIHYESRIITANKGTNRLHEYASQAINRGLEIIIAGSTEKSYLPGIIASKTEVPILGIQINPSTKMRTNCETDTNNNECGQIRMFDTESNGAVSAALFAASMLATKHPRVHKNLMKYYSQDEHGKTMKKTLTRVNSSLIN